MMVRLESRTPDRQEAPQVIATPTVVHDIHLVPRTGNTKTGPMPVTYRPMHTCPVTCPLLPAQATGGCYGTGRLFGSAKYRAVSLDVERAVWKVRLGADAAARHLRDRVVGDVVTATGELDREYLAAIAEIATANELTPFGYTHAWRLFTAEDVAWLRALGYVMNASVETPAQAEQAAALGMLVTIVDDERPGETEIAGMRLVTCPAQTRDGITCATCGLCATPDRPTIVRFIPHGTAVQRARRAVAAARNADSETAAE
jgi:hypothetical protein